MALAKFLGWEESPGRPQERLYDALTALEHIDAGAMTESDFDGLSTKQTQAVLKVGRVESSAHDSEAADHRKKATEARRQAKRGATEKVRRAAKKRQKEAEAKARAATQKGREAAAPVMRGIGQKLRDGDIRLQDAPAEAHKFRGSKETPVPRIDKFTHKLMNNLRQFLDPKHDKRVEKLDEIVRFVDDLDEGYRESAAMTLRVIGDRCHAYADKIAPKAKPIKTAKAAAKTAAKAGGEVVYLPKVKPRKRTRTKGGNAA